MMRDHGSIVAPAINVNSEIDDCAKAWKRLGHIESLVAGIDGERVAVGRKLIELRKHWPARGPKAKGWGEALQRIGIESRTALNYMQLAGYVERQEISETVSETPTYAEAGIDKRPRKPSTLSDELRDAVLNPAPGLTLVAQKPFGSTEWEPISSTKPKAEPPLSGDVVEGPPPAWVAEIGKLSADFQRHASALFSVGERMEQLAREHEASIGAHRLSHIRSTILAARSSLAATLNLIGGTNA